jgi:class 3 adenylate cyclase
MVVPGAAAGGLPSGAVTFLFSDIEGSTRLVKALRAEYPRVLAEHRSLVRAAVAARGGHEVDAQGRTDAQIAAQLNIRVRTVGSDLDRIRDQTGSRRRSDLTRLALQEALV